MTKVILKLGIPILVIVAFIVITALMPLMLLGGKDLENLRYDNNPAYSGAEEGLGKIRLTGTGQLSWPAPGKLNIASGFGMRFHPILKVNRFHSGIDITMNEGERVRAAGAGTVKLAGWSEGYGNLVIIKHNDSLETYYGHNSKLLVTAGQNVSVGDTIALAGSTGLSTGPHLHFEVRLNNEPVDPARYIGITADIPDVLPEELKYRPVNADKVIKFLNRYNSILADKQYVDPIIKAGEFYKVNPLLLFAITGQEQSFVPRNTRNAEKIARNPFNVYHSWYEYSPGIEKSAMVAAHTIVNLSKGRLEMVNPLKWLNSPSNPRGVYAEDPRWYIGVSKFFDKLKNDVGYEN